MNIFYTQKINGEWAFLEEEESRHAVQVLRKRSGDPIDLIDGRGGWYHGTLFEVHKNRCSVRIEQSRQEEPPPVHLHLAIAPTKNMNRLEWLFEKAVEIGIQEISFIHCAHSERKKIRMDRLEKILLAATKQSLRARLPQLNPLIPFRTFVEKPVADTNKYIAYIDDSVKLHFKDNYPAGKDVIILVGPEGGFHPDEALLAQKNGFVPVSLGPRRYRTETAGLLVVTIVNLTNQ